MTEHTTTRGRTSTMRVPRTRGALSGLLLIALGAWGALIPFIGPYFNYAYTPDTAWSWTMGRFWLEVLPGAVTVLGGLILLSTANRANAALGGWLASAAGAWFIVGPFVSRLWAAGPEGDAGSPVGATNHQVLVQIGFFYGLGAVILFLAAHAAGRVTVRSVRDLELAERHGGVAAGQPVEPRRSERTTERGSTAMDGGTADRSEGALAGGERRRKRGLLSRRG